MLFAGHFDIPCSPRVSAEIVVLNDAATSFLNPDGLIAVRRDSVAAQSRIAALRDRHTRTRVGEDLVVFQRPLAVFENKDPVLLPVVNAVSSVGAVAPRRILRAPHASRLGKTRQVATRFRPLAPADGNPSSGSNRRNL